MLKLIQESTTSNVYEDERGQQFEVVQDSFSESPLDWWDTIEAITIDGKDSNFPTYPDSDGAEWDVLDVLRNHIEDNEITTDIWEKACKACGIDNPNVMITRVGYNKSLVAFTGDKNAPVKTIVETYNQWVRGNVFVISPIGGCVEETICGVYANSEADAVQQVIENNYFG